MKKINENIKLIIGIIVAIVISSMISIKAATTLSSTSVYYDTSNSGGSSSNVNGAIDELYSLTTDRDKLKAEIVNIIYPVGSIYMSTEDDTVEKVQDKFGGTWVKYAENMTLVGASSTKAVNTTGGSSSVTLSNKNIPSLSVTGTTNSTGNGYTVSYTSTSRNTNTTGNHTHTLGENVVFSTYNDNGNYISRAIDWGANDSNMKMRYFSVTSSGNHYHTVSDYYANKITGVEAHTHPFTGNYTNSSPQSINIQNPYTVVYMYKRTA